VDVGGENIPCAPQALAERNNHLTPPTQTHKDLGRHDHLRKQQPLQNTQSPNKAQGLSRTITKQTGAPWAIKISPVHLPASW
jgi:hypothetical protein